MKPDLSTPLHVGSNWLGVDSRPTSTVAVLQSRKNRYLVVGAAVILDTFLLVAALVAANVLWFRFEVPAANVLFYQHFFGAYLLARIVCLFGFGLYNASAFEARSLTVLSIVEFVAITTVLELGVATTYFFYSETDVFRFSRPALLLKAGIEVFALCAGRIALIRVVETFKLLQRRTLVVGTNAGNAATLLGKGRETAWRSVVGYLDEEPLKDRLENEAAFLGKPDEVARVLSEQKIDELIVLADVDLRNRVLSQVLSHTLSIKVLPRGLESVVSKRHTYEVHDIPLVEINRTSTSMTTLVGKRLLDLATSTGGLLLAAPLFASLWVIYRLFHGGDMIYTQPRIGRDGRIFTVYKIRTMVKNAEELSGAVKCHGRDPRVFRLGWILRRTHLDELPQLWNIFRGDMSFVGPRPERPELAAGYQADDPAYNLRHIVRPGLTGLAQVKGSYDTNYEYKLFYDLLYAFNATVLMDLQIIYYTPKYILAELFGEKNQY